MAPDAPLTYYKFGPSPTATTGIVVVNWNAPTVQPRREFSIPATFRRTYESELRAARAGPSVEKLRKQLGWIYLWWRQREAAQRAAERHRSPPAICPQKARTEWGMVHRERCVHRMGLN